MKDQSKASEPRVWLARVGGDLKFQKPILATAFQKDVRAGLSTREERDLSRQRAKDLYNTYKSGVVLTLDVLETEFSLLPKRPKPAGPPVVMSMGGFTVVTAETRALLEGLNPGPMLFHPINVANAARTAPLWDGAELFIVQFLEVRRETLIDQSGALSKTPDAGSCSDGVGRYLLGPTDGPDPMVVLPPKEDGAEIWMDDRVENSIFLSDRVAQAIKAAKMTRAWGLLPCRVAHVN